MCELSNELFFKEMYRIERGSQGAEQRYLTYDIAFWAVASALIAIVYRTVDIIPILYKVFDLFLSKLM